MVVDRSRCTRYADSSLTDLVVSTVVAKAETIMIARWWFDQGITNMNCASYYLVNRD